MNRRHLLYYQQCELGMTPYLGPILIKKINRPSSSRNPPLLPHPDPFLLRCWPRPTLGTATPSTYCSSTRPWGNPATGSPPTVLLPIREVTRTASGDSHGPMMSAASQHWAPPPSSSSCYIFSPSVRSPTRRSGESTMPLSTEASDGHMCRRYGREQICELVSPHRQSPLPHVITIALPSPCPEVHTTGPD